MHRKLRRQQNFWQSHKTEGTTSELWGYQSSQDLRGQDLREKTHTRYEPDPRQFCCLRHFA